MEDEIWDMEKEGGGHKRREGKAKTDLDRERSSEQKWKERETRRQEKGMKVEKMERGEERERRLKGRARLLQS